LQNEVTSVEEIHFTPGTPFMHRLHQYLLNWLNLQKDKLPKTTIYSSHLVPGEGEQKIMDLIRSGQISTISGKAHVFNGLDMDLVMLSLLAPLNNIYLRRDDVKFGTEILDIENLRREIVGMMSLGKEKYKHQDFKISSGEDDITNQNLYIVDFIIMMFMIGNDFLPHPPAVGEVNYSVEMLIEGYLQLSTDENIVHLVDGKGNINWLVMKEYFNVLADMEPEMLMERAIDNQNMMYKSESLAVALTTDEIQVKGITGEEKFETNYNFDPDVYRVHWYSNVFGLRGASDITPEITAEDLDKIIEQYLRGFSWVKTYYLHGQNDINPEWFYNYYHTPLFEDVANYLNENMEESMNLEIGGFLRSEEHIDPGALEQLLAVIPLKYNFLIPDKLHPMQKRYLMDYYPKDFIIELDGLSEKDSWRGIAILPFVNLHRIRKTIRIYNRDNPISRLTLQESKMYEPQNMFILERDPLYRSTFETIIGIGSKPSTKSRIEAGAGASTFEKPETSKQARTKFSVKKLPPEQIEVRNVLDFSEIKIYADAGLRIAKLQQEQQFVDEWPPGSGTIQRQTRSQSRGQRGQSRGQRGQIKSQRSQRGRSQRGRSQRGRSDRGRDGQRGKSRTGWISKPK